MSLTDVLSHRLESMHRELAARGEEDLAQQAAETLALLHGQVVTEPPGGVITVSEAAALLGVKSTFTVKRWIREGQLQGYRSGGRIMVSRASAEQLASSPVVASQRGYEAGRATCFSAFGPDDEDGASNSPTVTTPAGS
ncbi:MAG: helix-turn-helix domain-containing protein [Chloroflexi bacterium]|nr:helix-turn-helix domain-containing protein [Chloroflexota bacterium]